MFFYYLAACFFWPMFWFGVGHTFRDHVDKGTPSWYLSTMLFGAMFALIWPITCTLGLVFAGVQYIMREVNGDS